MAAPFPSPPGVIARTLDELRIAAAAIDESEHEARRVALLPRPWDPADCPAENRRNVYVWLDDVVAWINEEHTWRTDRVIPLCWDLHPHIVHELATVACLRWEATFARTAAVLEEWHRPVHAASVPGARRRSDRRDRLPTGAPPAEPWRWKECDLSKRRRAGAAARPALAGRRNDFDIQRREKVMKVDESALENAAQLVAHVERHGIG
jgi:hypothetical protein